MAPENASGGRCRFRSGGGCRSIVPGTVSAVSVLACLTLIGLSPVCHAIAGDSPTDDSERGVLAQTALVAVPVPDLADMQEEVRRALRGAREEVDISLADDQANAGDLGAAFGSMGMLYHAHLVFEPADACYENAQRLNPRDPRWPYYRGYLAEQQGRLDPARLGYVSALVVQPDFPLARLRLGLLELQAGKLTEAQGYLKSVLDRPDLAAAAFFGLGEAALARRDYEEGAGLLEQALKAAPEASSIHYALAMAYRSLGDIDRAQAHLQQRGEGVPAIQDPLVDMLASLSTGHRMFFHYGLSASYRQQYAEAARMFRKGLELDPENVSARVSLARFLYLQGNPDGAEEQLRETLSRSPDNASAHFFLGLLAEEKGSQDEAVAHFQSALAAEPGHAGAHFYLANILMRTGRFNQAALHYSKSLLRDPDNPHARLREILALAQGQADHRQLRRRLEEAYALQPDEPLFAHLLAALLAASPDEAVRDGGRAVALGRQLYENSPGPEQARLLAMAYAESGEFDAAVEFQSMAGDLAMASGRYDMMPRLLEDLGRFRRFEPPRTPWTRESLNFGVPAGDPTSAFAGYPVDAPY